MKRTLIGIIGILTLASGLYFLRAKPTVVVAARATYACPMRCLKKTYDAPGKCPVCHMELVKQGGLSGHSRVAGLDLWPRLAGKTAIYFRPYTLRPLTLQKTFRVAGVLSDHGLVLKAAWDPAWEGWLQPGQTAMLAPVSGQIRNVLGRVTKVSPQGLVIAASRAVGVGGPALADIIVSRDVSMAVPVEAVWMNDGKAHALLKQGEGYRPVELKLGTWGDRFVEVKEGLKVSDEIAGSGLFWLQAELAMNQRLR